MDYNDSCTFSESHGLHGPKDKRKIQLQESSNWDSKKGRCITSDFCKTATSRSEIHLIPTRQLHAATKMARTLAVEDSLTAGLAWIMMVLWFQGGHGGVVSRACHGHSIRNCQLELELSLTRVF